LDRRGLCAPQPQLQRRRVAAVPGRRAVPRDLPRPPGTTGSEPARVVAMAQGVNEDIVDEGKNPAEAVDPRPHVAPPASFDVFLSHNSRDKPTVERLAERLKR